jgi:hypothetical protein
MDGVKDRRSIEILLVLLLLALALLLRTWVGQDAFWLDEIWSYYISKLVNTPMDVLTGVRIDNNHPLNTLYMYLAGEQPDWFIYRLPAVILGTATVAVLGLGAAKLGGKPWVTMLLGTVSIPLIQYSTEARGYGPAAFFGVSAWYIYTYRIRNATAPGWTIAFWLTCALGFASHITFVFVFLALALARAIELLGNEQLDKTGILREMPVFIPPGLFFIWMYAVFYGQTVTGGDQPELGHSLSLSLLQLGQNLAGAPHGALWSMLACLLVTGLAIMGLRQLPTKQRWFFAAVLAIVPAAIIIPYQPKFFFPRYLFVCVPFFYLLAGRALDCGLRAAPPFKIATLLILTLMLLGNGLLFRDLARWGKGDYSSAINQMYSLNPGKPFTVGGDFDFRHTSIINFYSRFRTDKENLVYIEDSYLQDKPTDFYIAHDFRHEAGANTYLQLSNGFVYKIIGIYPYAGFSGWNWYVYSLVNDSESAD